MCGGEDCGCSSTPARSDDAEQFAFCYTRGRNIMPPRPPMWDRNKSTPTTTTTLLLPPRRRCRESCYHDDCEPPLGTIPLTRSLARPAPPVNKFIKAAISELHSRDEDSYRTTAASVQSYVADEIKKEDEAKRQRQMAAAEEASKKAVDAKAMELRCPNRLRQSYFTSQTIVKHQWQHRSDNDSYGSWEWKHRKVCLGHSSLRIFFSHRPTEGMQAGLLAWLESRSKGTSSIDAAWSFIRDADSDVVPVLLGPTKEELQAATEIQRVVRGYCSRRKFKQCIRSARRMKAEADAAAAAAAEAEAAAEAAAAAAGEGGAEAEAGAGAEAEADVEAAVATETEMTGMDDAIAARSSNIQDQLVSDVVEAKQTMGDDEEDTLPIGGGGPDWRWRRRTDDEDDTSAGQDLGSKGIETKGLAAASSTMGNFGDGAGGFGFGFGGLASGEASGEGGAVADLARREAVQSAVGRLFDSEAMRSLAGALRIQVPCASVRLVTIDCDAGKVSEGAEVEAFLAPLLEAVGTTPACAEGTNRQAGERLRAFITELAALGSGGKMDGVASLEEWRAFLSDYLTPQGVRWAVARSAAERPLPFSALTPLECFGFDEWAAKELRYSMKEVVEEEAVEEGHDDGGGDGHHHHHHHHHAEDGFYDEWDDDGWNERAESEKQRRIVRVVPLVGEDRLAWLGKSLSTAFGYSSAALQSIGDVASLAAALASPLRGDGGGGGGGGGGSGRSAVLSRHGKAAEAVAFPGEPTPGHLDEGNAIASLDLVREAIFAWHPTVLRKRLWIPNCLALDVARCGGATPGAPNHHLVWLLLEMLHTRMGLKLNLIAQVPANPEASSEPAKRWQRPAPTYADGLAIVFAKVHGATVVRDPGLMGST